MPTGYTDMISKGVSFKEYALHCAKAFTVECRDQNELPDKIEPSSYNLEAAERDENKIDELENLSLEECEIRSEQAFEDRRKSLLDSIQKKKELEKKYDDMLAEVEKYTPPTPLHENYKNFMETQIKDSIDWDCDTSYYEKELENLTLDTGGNWREKEITELKRSVEYNTNAHKEEVERAKERNEWLQQLKESLN